MKINEALVIMLTTICFGLVERIMKEDWVLYDSFKRAQNLYMKLVDKLPTPNFVTDTSGRILHMNYSAKVLYERSKKSRMPDKIPSKDAKGLIKMVHPDYKKTVEEFLKKATREFVSPIDVPILVNPPDNKLECVCDLGLDIHLMNQGNVHS